MRDAFREIVSGWTLRTVEEIGAILDRAAAWAKDNGPLEQDEKDAVWLVATSGTVQAIARGDFLPFIRPDEAERFAAAFKEKRQHDS